ncbi:hypothetical protein [Peribacillus asahii]|uniref:hypothetical protein n=1 Tax=Peribacillus asahii TaxID=228899 RepID=UPI00207A7883|nr:hypothetical protein [Peribacillus asahii]USK62179.1 hypothetical protein LIT37_23670 [Peribacillus asahii]
MLPTYQEIKEKLIAPFPKGTVEVERNKAHIPVQAYINRLEEAAGEHWSWKTNGQPLIYEKECQIQVKGTLKILNAEREGVGFSNFKVYEDNKEKIQNLKYAILAAESDALRNACNKYQMGWSDLAQYKDWGKNPGVGVTVTQPQTSQPVAEFTCLKCGKPLQASDLQELEKYQIRNKYCSEDIPAHMRKKR